MARELYLDLTGGFDGFYLVYRDATDEAFEEVIERFPTFAEAGLAYRTALVSSDALQAVVASRVGR